MQALLYRRTEHWRIGLAFVAAFMLHAAAIALATRNPEPVVVLTEPPPIDVEPIEPLAEPPRPPQEELDSSTPPPPIDPPIFTDETPTPPHRMTVAQVSKPFVRQTTTSPRMASAAAGHALALNAPRPDYPYQARRQHLTGSGVATFIVDPASGAVLDVAMSRSTGNSILDNAAISGFRRWRFKPGTPPKVQTPITFTLTGAAY